ncbi:MAG: HAMP domain-containing protein [Desulfobacter sp.]|nr:HAMP domain-containing protein [Desulfobacter sp.]WDP88092.1 MAG: HAMP domain-containing protein [Desulfobacter sp.]
MPDFFRTIAFRLTVWYAGIFSISSCVVFALFYFLATQTILNQIDQELMDKAGYFRTAIQRNGIVGAQNLAVIEAQAAGEKQIFFRLLYPTGEVFASSHMSYWKDVGIDDNSVDRLMHKQVPVFKTVKVTGHHQNARMMYAFVAQNVILHTGLAMNAHSRFLSSFKKIFSISMGFVIFFSAVSGMFLARQALSGVAAITRTASTIKGSNLDQRVPETGNQDELDLLAVTFNRMLDRISALVKSIREISDNIAHDLKSPLTRIRGFAELALIQAKPDDIETYEAMAANTIEESDRLLDMINTMLVISRAEGGEETFEFVPMDLSSLVSDACDLFVPVAEDKQIRFTHKVEPEIRIKADPSMLQRAFSNIVDNALKYTPEKGEVQVSLTADTDGQRSFVSIRVADTGPGIKPDCLEKIFERFFRAESSRTTQGTGLGLSLAKTIVEQHKGEIFVENRNYGGSVFCIRLPYRHFEII